MNEKIEFRINKQTNKEEYDKLNKKIIEIARMKLKMAESKIKSL